MYQYPKDLIDFLTEQESEGAEIFTTQTLDETMWIVKGPYSTVQYTLVTWSENDAERWHRVTLSGMAISRLKKVMSEGSE